MYIVVENSCTWITGFQELSFFGHLTTCQTAAESLNKLHFLYPGLQHSYDRLQYILLKSLSYLRNDLDVVQSETYQKNYCKHVLSGIFLNI